MSLQSHTALYVSRPHTLYPRLTELQLSLANPGQYKAILNYYNNRQTVATWFVRETPKKPVAKNVLFFIGDGGCLQFKRYSSCLYLLIGMTQSMITAARLIAHKSINGVYQSLMQMDQMEALGQ